MVQITALMQDSSVDCLIRGNSMGDIECMKWPSYDRITSLSSEISAITLQEKWIENIAMSSISVSEILCIKSDEYMDINICI